MLSTVLWMALVAVEPASGVDWIGRAAENVLDVEASPLTVTEPAERIADGDDRSEARQTRTVDFPMAAGPQESAGDENGGGDQPAGDGD
jgi:hypothetical protein